jgi:hypothetical protein
LAISGHHRAGLAAQEVLGLVDQGLVVVLADQAGARRGAALDLVQHAGPRAGLVDAVAARAQQEGLLQGVERAVHRPGAGERPEIVALDRVGAAVLAQLRRVVIAADHDLGKALVVAQQHVEARLQRLDQVDLEQQGVGFGAGGDELHRPRGVDHVGDAVGVEAALGVLDDPLLQALGLADVEDFLVLADHPVDAGRVGQARDLVLDQGGALQGVGGGDVGGRIGHARHIGESGAVSDLRGCGRCARSSRGSFDLVVDDVAGRAERDDQFAEP